MLKLGIVVSKLLLVLFDYEGTVLLLARIVCTALLFRVSLVGAETMHCEGVQMNGILLVRRGSIQLGFS